jgi:hypothetical protein
MKAFQFDETIKKGISDINAPKRVEMMTTNKKMVKALKSAITYLDNSMLAMDKKDDGLLTDSVWHAAAELEYALFLFSISIQNEIDKSKWKLNPKFKKAEVGPTLITVQELLNEAEKCMKNEKLLDAYKSTYIARNYMLKVQKDFAKKKREALQKKK